MATGTEVQAQSLKQALVAGGQASFVADKLSKSLARHGIRIHTHWSWDKKKPPQKFPDGIDLVYICTDMIGHNLANPCVEYARTAGIPFVNGTRKWAESIERLAGAGFPLVDVASAVPELIAESRTNKTPKQLAEWPTEEDLRDFVSVLGLIPPEVSTKQHVPNTINTSVATTAAVATLPPAQEPHMSATNNIHLAITNPKQREYLRALAVKPDADNVDLWEVLAAVPMFAGFKFDPERAASARKTLGISIVRKNGLRTVSVNIPVFNAALKVAKIEGIATPQAVYSSPDPAFKPAPQPVVVPKAPPPPPVAVVPVAPPPKVEAPKQPISPMAELKDIVALLRDKMKEMNIVDLHVTSDGVKYKQVTVVEGSLED